MIEKKQEAALQGHTSSINTIALSAENLFIISGSGSSGLFSNKNIDKSVRVWSLSDKRQEAVLNFNDKVSLVEVDCENNITISFNYGKKKIINLKKLLQIYHFVIIYHFIIIFIVFRFCRMSKQSFINNFFV